MGQGVAVWLLGLQVGSNRGQTKGGDSEGAHTKLPVGQECMPMDYSQTVFVDLQPLCPALASCLNCLMASILHCALMRTSPCLLK